MSQPPRHFRPGLLKRGAWEARPCQLPALDRAGELDALGAVAGAPSRAQVSPERAWQDGFELGLADARRQAQSEAPAERTALEAECRSIAELLDGFEQRLAMFALAMSLELSRLVLRSSVRIKADLVLPSLRDALGSLVGLNPETRIRLHPADAGRIRSLDTSGGAAPLPWPIVEDDTLAPGQCRLTGEASVTSAGGEAPWRRAVSTLNASGDWVDFTDRSGRETTS
jgi:flagellar assembly protein FliH